MKMNQQYQPAKLEILPIVSVLKEVRRNGKADVWIAPSKVAPHHVNDGWFIGANITVHLVEELDHSKGYYVFTPDDTGLEKAIELNKYLQIYKQWNCNSELGQRVRFWKEVK